MGERPAHVIWRRSIVTSPRRPRSHDAMQHPIAYANLAVDAFFTVRYTLLHRACMGHARARAAREVNDGTASMRRLNSNQANSRCVLAERSFPLVRADGQPILARAKLSALRSRGKCVAGYSPPILAH
ncbi:hypothetical protein [Luteibacter sp. UNC138MFCol5.1]|uniref:hypothetical protein n=1 Tax=Luteibacter sp. UNC138MFCol5.1 TaxID=1502774 RepID=UPI001160ABEC|nr:hypothetical protein [Luteibacter sp. UNC138MFCol5.1]